MNKSIADILLYSTHIDGDFHHYKPVRHYIFNDFFIAL